MSRRPRIILEALQVRHDPAGTGRGILDLCRALAARDRGLDFSVLVTEPEVFGDLGAHPGWDLVPCPGARGGAMRKALFTQMQIPGLVRRLGGDILHCMQFLAPLRCPRPLVATVHDLAWLMYPETVEEPRRTYYRWLVPRTLSRAAAITVNSRATADETARLFPSVERRLRVTPHGTPSWVLDRGPAQILDEARRPFFLFVGTMEPRKKLTRLLDAYEIFMAGDDVGGLDSRAIPDLVLVGGKGWKDTGLRSRLATLTEGGKLFIHDYCDDDTLWGLYGSAIALVFPSLHEGFGLPILEAMAAGLPVLTSNRAGMREVAGDKALLVDPENVVEIAEGLRVMAFEPTVRSTYAAAGPARARMWSWSRTADLTEAVYRELLSD